MGSLLPASDRSLAEAIIQTIREPLLVLSGDLRVRLANPAFYDAFRVTPEETLTRPFYELGTGQWNVPELRNLLEQFLPAHGAFQNLELELEFADVGPRTLLFNGRSIPVAAGQEELMLLTMEDITERRKAERKLAEQQEQVRAANRRMQRTVVESNHRIKNNLQLLASLVDIQLLHHEESIPVDAVFALARHIRGLAALHDALTMGAKRAGVLRSLSARAVLERLLPTLEPLVGDRSFAVDVEDVRITSRQASALTLIVNELVTNAAKHSKGSIWLQLTAAGRGAELVVQDEGAGFPEDFDPAAMASTGLDLVHSLATMDLRGEVYYRTGPEGGGRVSVTFPLLASRAVPK